MDSYKNFLNSLPLVLDSEEQEKLLLKYFQTRDEDVREKILVHNLRLCAQGVMNFCNKYGMGKFQEDFFSVCYEQLSNSLDRYNPSKDASFATFALKNMALSLMRYSQKEDYFSSHLVETVTTADNSSNEDSDMFCFLFDDTHLQQEVQTEIFRDEIIKFIDNINGPENKKQMIKMYLGLGFARRYSQSEIASIFNCSRETASTTISRYKSLVQKYVAENYENIFPDYADKVRQNSVKFKTIAERNQYILNSYYNEDKSKSIGELSRELGITKSCISEVIRNQKFVDKSNNAQHLIQYKKGKNLDKVESIFIDRYGLNSAEPLSKQELITKYNLPESAYKYSHMLKDIEELLIREGRYTAEQIEQIRQAYEEKKQEIRLLKYKEIYHSARGDEGYQKKSLVQLAMENHVAVSTVRSWIAYYKNFAEAKALHDEAEQEN